ncbi:hypothetical protein GGU10DRAFT_437904 [Lentinula aff. detonsa]|uniref:Uncharacterized protein n=1 Tax=Lentinula aff. detonsa TaxID=2804958 RepID=A0AA38NB81_9AGAR|nr:hypothetical protein GGU10DRAFT_437904 [Lentinula aff. detonsa]
MWKARNVLGGEIKYLEKKSGIVKGYLIRKTLKMETLFKEKGGKEPDPRVDSRVKGQGRVGSGRPHEGQGREGLAALAASSKKSKCKANQTQSGKEQWQRLKTASTVKGTSEGQFVAPGLRLPRPTVWFNNCPSSPINLSSKVHHWF